MLTECWYDTPLGFDEAVTRFACLVCNITRNSTHNASYCRRFEKVCMCWCKRWGGCRVWVRLFLSFKRRGVVASLGRSAVKVQPHVDSSHSGNLAGKPQCKTAKTT